ncbi:prepilin-type N-terminal cleavage/methylation domain-containing protein [Bacillus sp. cl95]|uniref:prepilin-type N-terminal cleavage/methylation domain-containing protein n=2 Tax=unclassified Bacillus (in: firmicutes) TaxID=185979 RepID=UPI0008E6A90A|nr:prepilin-type N-terminal cleavage/methylation domain-containing protein [Bacillus sp. cl95]SFB16292.1 type IV pilus assembly protein PilA [Bacillus sp. UNCCL13]SFQ78154.1 type IV pilus assembly protein PilA [Bacillus sp. cl95]
MFKALKQKMKDQRGLTLIELLAVIVILGIIAAIAIPAIGNLIDNSKQKATINDGLQIINSAKLYVTENPTDLEISPTELQPYLDGQKSNFTKVTVSKTSGVLVLNLFGHDSVALVNGKTSPAGTATSVTEKNLLDY